MKQISLAVALAFAMSMGVAKADNTGCGLGTIAWEGQSGVVPQVLAVTTNGTFGNQTFGITTGTLGCKTDGVVSLPIAMFAGSNMDRIARDMSTGEGEALETLAELIGIEAVHRDAFYRVTRENFSVIFHSSDITAEQMLDALHQVMLQDPELARYTI